MHRHIVFVFANLKPSQVSYKVIPLSQSKYIEKVIILRKEHIEINNSKITCLAIPGILKYRPFYWIFVPFYGIYLIKRNHVSIILNYNIFPHGFNAFFASVFTKLPVIFSEINEDTIKYHHNKCIKSLINKIISNAWYITTPGSKTQAYWLKAGFLKVARLHSTIDTNHFIPGNKLRTIDFIYIGEFDDNKRPDLILNAFADIRARGIKANLSLIGFGAMQSELEKKVSQYGINECVSIIKTHDVLSYLQQSKIFIMASLSEGIPCALLESMSCKVIPIVPDVGDITDVIQNSRNGILYDNTFTELTKWMEYTFFNYNSLSYMAENARKTIIDNHSYEVAVKKWNGLLQLLDQKN